MDDQNKSMNERWAPPADRGERGYATDPGYSSGREYASRPDYGTTSPEPDPTAERTAEIRSDIDRTRADMGETIDAIQDRLDPRSAAARAAENVREATVGRVRAFAGRFTDRESSGVREWDNDPRYHSRGWDGSPRGNGLMERIRENPMAAAMAAGSIAWLLLGNRRHHGGFRSDSRDNAMYGSTRGMPYLEERHIDVEGSPERFAGRYQQESGWSARESDTTGRAQHAMAEAGSTMRQAAAAAQHRGRRFASDSPLAAGAIAAAAGLVIGLMIPETERENEILGDARDSMVERGKDAVRTAAERVQNAAGEVQRVAGDALKGVAPGESAQDSRRGSAQAQSSQATSTRGTNQASSGTSAGPAPAVTTGIPETGATERAVPGMQAGSGGTGSTPTARGSESGRPKTKQT